MKKIAHLFLLTLVLLGLSSCSAADDRAIYTLYRGSVVGVLRIHLATFDADAAENYNFSNCQLAARLFMSQPGVTVSYWCEKGRFED